MICHSRGGLVTRWWLEILDHYAADSGAEEPARGRVIFAGSPLAGTGLAAPHRLKAAIDVLTNISRALEWTARGAGIIVPAAAPLAHAAGVLFSMFGKLTALAARTPILDAGISMVPGLNAQSRVGTNREIAELRDAIGRRSGRPAGRFLADYYFLTSNFETDSPGWKFWKYFRKDKLADIATDMVFDGANDLVVDTPSMTSLADECEPVAGHVLDYGTNNVVHHCNYFQQPTSIEFIRKTLLE